jgi:hypothetical protein
LFIRAFSKPTLHFPYEFDVRIAKSILPGNSPAFGDYPGRALKSKEETRRGFIAIKAHAPISSIGKI